MKICISIFLVFIFSLSNLYAIDWQWSVEMKTYISPETGHHPRAFLWIPPTCNQVKGVVVGQHNMCEEVIFEHSAFRAAMTDLDFAIIWITPGIDQQWNVANGCQEYFDSILKDLADVSGYSELQFAPIVPIGHSAMATFPWNFAAWNPERTLAIISYKGDAPRTNLTGYGRENLEWGRTRNLDGIPGLMIEGEYEWWEARVNPALAFKMMYPESCISFLCDTGQGHFDVSDKVVDYISLFLKKAAQYRLPQKQALDRVSELIKIDNNKGWLAERWRSDESERSQAAPVSQYQGDIHDAFWYFDQEMAEATESYYSTTRGKKDQYIGFTQNGKLLPYDEKLHARITAKFIPLQDGLTFSLDAKYTDSMRVDLSNEHEKGKINISRICGPVTQLDDTTFSVRFYRMGMLPTRRTGEVWLLASSLGDENYKSSVQQISIQIPFPIKKGKEQEITFKAIADTKIGTKRISLSANSTSNLPVHFYVKEGPIKVVGNKIIINEIPPRTKYPLKATVVAWQYGIDKIWQTAQPVERSFYINK